MKLQKIRSKLEASGVIFSTGLTDSEVSKIELECDFKFPPDLRNFLQFCLPISDGWVKWRSEPWESLRSYFSKPCDGICFDVTHNDYWLNSWGEKPKDNFEAISVVKNAISNAPKLVPIYGHRYIPDYPNEIRNPVYSIHQTDIIVYGENLQSYFQNEFKYDQAFKNHNKESKEIDFWSELETRNND